LLVIGEVLMGGNGCEMSHQLIPAFFILVRIQPVARWKSGLGGKCRGAIHGTPARSSL